MAYHEDLAVFEIVTIRNKIAGDHDTSYIPSAAAATLLRLLRSFNRILEGRSSCQGVQIIKRSLERSSIQSTMPFGIIRATRLWAKRGIPRVRQAILRRQIREMRTPLRRLARAMVHSLQWKGVRIRGRTLPEKRQIRLLFYNIRTGHLISFKLRLKRIRVSR